MFECLGFKNMCVCVSCLFWGIVISMGLNLACTAVKSALEVI